MCTVFTHALQVQFNGFTNQPLRKRTKDEIQPGWPVRFAYNEVREIVCAGIFQNRIYGILPRNRYDLCSKALGQAKNIGDPVPFLLTQAGWGSRSNPALEAFDSSLAGPLHPLADRSLTHAQGVGYLLLGIGGALWVLFLGRIIDGLTGANSSVIMAYVADITPPNQRSKYFGWIGAANNELPTPGA